RQSHAGAAGGLRLPLPRRPVRHRGQPHRRPARARARPLRVLDRQRQALPRQPLQRRQGEGRGRERADQEDGAPRPRRARRRLGVLALPGTASALMATTTRPPTTSQRRKQELAAALLYPVDWLEERSGLIGGLRYFLFRKVPRDTNWMQTLGSATLTAF